MKSDPNAAPRLSIEIGEVSETLRRYVERASTLHEATMDNLVRVQVGNSMNVVAIEFLNPKLDRETKQALEVATLGAVNAALRKAALAAGQAMAELEKTLRIRNGLPDGSGKP